MFFDKSWILPCTSFLLIVHFNCLLETQCEHTTASNNVSFNTYNDIVQFSNQFLSYQNENNTLNLSIWMFEKQNILWNKTLQQLTIHKKMNTNHKIFDNIFLFLYQNCTFTFQKHAFFGN